MPVSDLTVRLVLLFLPGVICSYVIDGLTSHRQRVPFFFVLQSLVLGFVSYAFYTGLARLAHRLAPSSFCGNVVFLRALVDQTVPISVVEIVCACGVAIVVGLLFTTSSTYKLHMRLLRAIGVTRKFDELDVWGFAFNLRRGTEWATVRDHRNDLMYDGWVQAFSDSSDRPELLLRDVSVYRNLSRERLYQVGAAYIALDASDIAIEFRTVPLDPARVWREDEHAR